MYHYDHLGSIQAITLWGENSQVYEQMYAADAQNRRSLYSYDAWGQRRDAKDWKSYPWGQSTTAPVYTWGWDNPTTTADEDDLIPRGFTGHEMMDDLGLIHMNGRIYDPRLGRFLSADQLVQAPLILQSNNRYSYCFNNPLGLVDPSGYEAEMTDEEREQHRQLLEARTRALTGSTVQNVVSDALNAGGAGQERAATQTTSGSAQATPPTNDEQAVDSGAPATSGDTSVDSDTAPTTDQAGGGDQKQDQSTPLEDGPRYILSVEDPETGGMFCPVDSEGNPIFVPANYDINVNAAEAESHYSPWWFRDKVRNGGDWDYKDHGKYPEFESLGNFNYGYTGTAFGFPSRLLLMQAGQVQMAAGTSRPEWVKYSTRGHGKGGLQPPYGDDPRDQAMIRMGITARINHWKISVIKYGVTQ